MSAPYRLVAALATSVLATTSQAGVLLGRDIFLAPTTNFTLAGNDLAVYLYDPVAQLTWTRNAMIIGTPQTWSNANASASALTFGGGLLGGVPVPVVDDWRLPSVAELQGLFVGALGNPPGGPAGNTDPFVNWVLNEVWSSDAAPGATAASHFAVDLRTGVPVVRLDTATLRVLATRSGDVWTGAGQVPAPVTFGLVLGGLALLLVARRRPAA